MKGFKNKPKQVLKIWNEIWIFLKNKLLDFETFEWFWNSIENLNHEDFRNKAFEDSFHNTISNWSQIKIKFWNQGYF
jgi:hypothetical protein